MGLSLRDQTIKQLREEIAALKVERDIAATAFAEAQVQRDEARANLVVNEVAVDTARAERDEARAQAKDYFYAADLAARDAASLRALLREVEWMSVTAGGNTGCPSCSGRWPDHAPDCRLKAALEGRDADPR